MGFVLPILFLSGMIAVIWYLGTGRFGRSQTQEWIDRVRAHPRLFAFLDKHHGKFRAAGHYVEFGGLFLVLYWCWDAILSEGTFSWQPIPALAIAAVCVVAAWLDEMHQLRSGTRQFRRVDFLHSCCGISLAALAICWQAILRGL